MDLTSSSYDTGRDSGNSARCCSVNGQLELPVKFKNGAVLKLVVCITLHVCTFRCQRQRWQISGE